MDITHYAFATYIFLLVLAGAWFLAKVFRGGKEKDSKSSYEKEQRLFTMYQNLEDTLASFEELAEETRKSTEEALGRSEQALRQASEMVEEARRLSRQLKPWKRRPSRRSRAACAEGQNDARGAEQQKPERHGKRPRKSLPRGGRRGQVSSPLKMNEKIRLLSAQGLMPVEIAKTLGISVREVTLALELSHK